MKSLLPLTAGLALALAAGCGAQAPRTSIHEAVSQGRESLVKRHLDAGTDPNSRDTSDVTPLHLAAATGNADIAQLLLDKGADPTLKDNKGKTPRQVAMKYNHSKIAELLNPKKAGPGRRQLIDGGVGVSEVLDF